MIVDIKSGDNFICGDGWRIYQCITVNEYELVAVCMNSINGNDEIIFETEDYCVLKKLK